MGDFKREKLQAMPVFTMEIMSCFVNISRREAV